MSATPALRTRIGLPGADHLDLKVEASNAAPIRLPERVGMHVVERLP